MSDRLGHRGCPKISFGCGVVRAVMSVPIPAGYDDTLDFGFAIPEWGPTPFGNVFYVQLLEC